MGTHLPTVSWKDTMASKKLMLTCCMAFLGLAFADIMPKDFVSKMQVVENEAKALMHTEPKRANDDFVDPSLSRLMKKTVKFNDETKTTGIHGIRCQYSPIH